MIMKSSSRSSILAAALLAVILAACGAQPTALQPAATANPPSQPTVAMLATIRAQLEAMPTETAVQTQTQAEAPAEEAATATPEPTAAPTSTPAPALIQNMPAEITGRSTRMREGPGTLFPMVIVMQPGQKVTVLRKALGDDWIFVDTGRYMGWVSVTYTSLAGSDKIRSVPVMDVTNAVVLKGQVAQVTGEPLAGIEFSAYQGREKEAPPDTRAHSTADGSFYLYLPASANGIWRVSLTGIDCKSPIVDKYCRYNGSFVPRLVDVTVPGEMPLTFQYFAR